MQELDYERLELFTAAYVRLYGLEMEDMPRTVEDYVVCALDALAAVSGAGTLRRKALFDAVARLIVKQVDRDLDSPPSSPDAKKFARYEN